MGEQSHRAVRVDAPPAQLGAPVPVKPGGISVDLEDYQRIAETVGGPSLRWKDNVIQAGIVVGCTLLGALVGAVGWGWMGVLFGGAGMMIASTLISGLVLMVLGFVRLGKPRR